MIAPILRTALILPLLVLAIGGCTRFSGVEGPSNVYAAGSASRMFATSYRFIDSQYIRQIAIADIATDGLNALVEIDPALAFDFSGNRIQLANAGNIVADLPAPPPNDVGGWVTVTVDLIEAGRNTSAAVRAIPPEVLYEGIMDDAIGSLDRYTRYASASDAADDRADREGFGGVGITISPTESEGVDVLAVLPDTPAALAGVEVGDRILVVDGVSVLEKTVREVVALLRGPIGSKVTLTVRRGGSRELTLNVTRAYIIAPTVITSVDGDIAVVQIASFNVQTAQDLEQEIIAAYARAGGNLGAVILDLRNNPGGLLDQAVAVADLFLNSGLVGSAEGRHPDSHQQFLAYSGDIISGRPLVVLINGNTASAAEVLAAALQDLGRAVLVGSTSYGKGTVQTVNRLPNDGELTLTWSALHAPSGYIIHQLGVRPNVCTTGYRSAAAALRDAEQQAPAIAAAMRRWRTHRLLELDAEATLLRSQCEPEEDLDDIDMEVAQAILADPAAYQSLLNLAPRDFAAAPQD
ncbi:MAG: S41 family peptidase [Alphaproteobacteria bacterium]